MLRREASFLSARYFLLIALLLASLLYFEIDIQTAKADPGLYEHYNMGDDWSHSFYGIYWMAQTIQVGSYAHSVTSVRIKVFRTGTPGAVTASIRELDVNGHPAGEDLTSGTVDGDSFTADKNGAWYEIPLAECTLLPHNSYAIVLRAPSGNFSKRVYWRGDDSRPNYDEGDEEFSESSGTTWLSYVTTDLMFELWGSRGGSQSPSILDSNPLPSLAISCKSPASPVGFKVEIKGNLTCNGAALSDAPILLSYSANGGESWESLRLVTSGSDGSYSVTWMPQAMGYYLVRAAYEGNASFPGTTNVVNFALAQYAEDVVFSVTSNSTLSSLTFKPSVRSLVFGVTGSGTVGFADVHVAKSLVRDAASMEVYLDGTQIDYTVASTGDSWLLHFTYSHSFHWVTVNLGAPALSTGDLPANWMIYGAVAAIVVFIIATVVVLRQKKRQRVL